VATFGTERLSGWVDVRTFFTIIKGALTRAGAARSGLDKGTLATAHIGLAPDAAARGAVPA